MKQISVLMSTYNGEKYLETQINSIINQKDVLVNLLVRDDGSKDATIEILEKYKKNNKLDWYSDVNLGPARCFMDLIKNVDECDYYSFADQDDYWFEDKLKIGIEKLEKYDDIPAIYFCDKLIVDEKLSVLSEKTHEYIISFESAMMRNIVTGCTLIINSKMREVLLEYIPQYLAMHDEWIYRVCISIGGKCIYDNGMHMKYRQHQNNVIGSGTIRGNMKRRVNNFINCPHERSKTAKELLKGYSKYMNDYNIKVLEDIANCRKIEILKNKKFKTESFEHDFMFKMATILNKI